MTITNCATNDDWTSSLSSAVDADLDSGGVRIISLLETVFNLPMEQDLLFLATSGASQAGTVKVTTSPALDHIAMVRVQYVSSDDSSLQEVKICEATRGSRKRGIIILVCGNCGVLGSKC